LTRGSTSGVGVQTPPLPPEDLHARHLPIRELRSSEVLFRIHRKEWDPLFFGRAAEARMKQRWYAPDESYGVCYLAVDPYIAFAETMLRKHGLASVEFVELSVRAIASVTVLEPLRLVRFHGSGLKRLSADASVVHGPYEVTWAWSQAIHGHPDEVDGICYRARHDDSDFSVALFDRAQAKVDLRYTTILTSNRCSTLLSEWMDRYGLGITL